MPLTHRGIGVSISCNGEELEHYKPEVVDDATIQCYIPSEAGKEIAVNIHDQDTVLTKGVSMFLDGNLARSSWMEFRNLKMSEVYTSATTARNIQFANLEFQDEDEIEYLDTPFLEKLGTITIIPELGPIPERSKKLGCHRTTLTSMKTVPPQTTVHPIYLDTIEQPYARFIFRYQPAALLQAHGIMPRKRTAETNNDPEQFARAGSSTSQRAKRSSTLSPQPAERAPKRRALTQVNSSTVQTREPGSSSQQSRVKQEVHAPDPAQEETIQTLQESIQAARDTMLAAQAQLDRMQKRQPVKTERAPSPIRVGSAHGEVIDLTLDD